MEKKIEAAWTALVADQEAYRAKHGQYYALLPSPASVTDEESLPWAKLIPDNAAYDGSDISFNIGANVEASIRVREMVGGVDASYRNFCLQGDIVYYGEHYRRVKCLVGDADSGWFITNDEVT